MSGAVTYNPQPTYRFYQRFSQNLYKTRPDSEISANYHPAVVRGAHTRVDVLGRVLFPLALDETPVHTLHQHQNTTKVMAKNTQQSLTLAYPCRNLEPYYHTAVHKRTARGDNKI